MVKFICAIAGAALIAYLLGSCNASILVVRLLKGEDIRKFGSHNAGLTNTMRCFGKGAAGLTLLLDLSKGVIAVLLCKFLCTQIGVGLPYPDGTDVRFIGYIAGFFAIIGHILPLYYGFKGGKGVLVGVSVFLVTSPSTFVILIGVFALVLWRSRYVSLASIVATACCPIVTFLLSYLVRKESIGYALFYLILSACMAVLVIWMHHANIQRLRVGTENRFSFSKKEQKEN